MAKPTAARVVRKAPVARVSLSGNRASPAGDKNLHGQSHVQASSVLERLPQRAN
jgi:hypothetical protein